MQSCNGESNRAVSRHVRLLEHIGTAGPRAGVIGPSAWPQRWPRRGHTSAVESVTGALDVVRDSFDQAWRANRQYVLADAVRDLLGLLDIAPEDEVVDAATTEWLAAGRDAEVHLADEGGAGGAGVVAGCGRAGGCGE